MKFQQGFHGNYVGCAGSTTFNAPGTGSDVCGGVNDALNGIFYGRSRTRFGDILDGTSHTVMFGEILINENVRRSPGHDTRGRYYNCWGGGCLFSTAYPPNTSVGDRPDRWCIHLPPELPCAAGGEHVLSARSHHLGGAHVALADGSVRFISDTIELRTWDALGARNSGEWLGSF